LKKWIHQRLRLQITGGLFEARVLGVHAVLALHLFGLRLLLVVFKQRLYFVLEPVAKVFKVVVFQELLCAWPLTRVYPQTFSRKRNGCIIFQEL
jgi:hypothetical protein